MSFILPNWVPRDPNLLEGCINEEMKRMNKLQEEILKLESKSINPFLFKSPNADVKLPCPMTMKLHNTLIYKTQIIDYEYDFTSRNIHPTLYIATPHEIHYFQIPITKNNPIIKLPNPNTEIKNIAIFPDSIVTLFTNAEIVPYSLVNNSWKPPISISFCEPINVMKRIKNYIFLQTGINKISLLDSITYRLHNSKNLSTKTIIESYIPADSNECYFKTIEEEVFVVDIETMHIIHTVSLTGIFIYKLAIQSYGNYVFAYNDETTLQYDHAFKLAGQFGFGSTYMYAEVGLIFFLSETSQSQFQNENENTNNNENENKAHNNEENPEEEDNDAIISLSIASIQTNEVLATLSISKINIISFKVIYTKPGERYIAIKGDDNSISFWSLTFQNPQKDEHGLIIVQKIEDEEQKIHQQQQQQLKQFTMQNQFKQQASRKMAMKPSAIISNQQMTRINAPISPVNQATNVHLPPSNDNINQFDSNKVQKPYTTQKVIISQPKQYQNYPSRPMIGNATGIHNTGSNTASNNNNNSVHINKFNPMPPQPQIRTGPPQVSPQIKQQQQIQVSPQLHAHPPLPIPKQTESKK